MERNVRRALALVTCIATVTTVVAVAAAWSLPRTRAGRTRLRSVPLRAKRPLAAVLVPNGAGGTSLVVVDLTALRVVRRVRLRSMAVDMALDARTGRLVTAQCGGLGSEADDAAGIVDPATGAVSYVALPRHNPSAVAVLDGRAYLLHGWTDPGRPGTFFVSVVDPAAGRVLRRGYAPESTGLWATAAGRVWEVGRDEAGEQCPLISLAPSDLDPSVARADGRPVNAVLGDRQALYLLVTRLPAAEPTSGAVLELDPATLRPRRSITLAGLTHGAVRGAVSRTHVAVIDDLGEGESSHAITVVNRAALRVERTLHVRGAPAAIAAWGDRFVIVDRAGGTLQVIDAREGRVAGTVDLGSTGLPWTDLEVIQSGPGDVSGP